MQLLQQLKDCDWRSFEQLISEVLELHNYSTHWNVNLTINKVRRQFDIIASKGSTALLIDCKKWNNKKSKVAALKNAVLKHKERCAFYAELFQKELIPIIITYCEEPIFYHEGVYIVPLHKLNDFILKQL